MVFAFVAHQTIGTDAAKSRCEADSVFTKRSSTVVKAQKIMIGISHYLKPITAIAKTRGARAQLECFSPSPSRRRQRDDQLSDAMGVNMEFGWATTWLRTLEVQFSGPRSYRSTEPLAAPLGRHLIPTTKPWKLQLCLLRSRLIVKYININICELPMPSGNCTAVEADHQMFGIIRSLAYVLAAPPRPELELFKIYKMCLHPLPFRNYWLRDFGVP
ncbi:hypothetical protein B0H14DRAFT_3740013 [Mycena olivaceomarginata]|nr:hypothetical protein B0H14DRAFT_3740013 [Mycena olivaceomarginata]